MRVRTHCPRFWLIAVAVCIVAASGSAQEKQDVEKRVKELLAVIGKSEANAAPGSVEASRAAKNELTEMGEAAVPHLVEAVATLKPGYQPGYVAAQTLLKIGKPALPAIRAKWADLNDGRRWRFMPLLLKHDPDSVWKYVLNSLDAEADVQLQAWPLALQAQDPKAKDRYFEILEGQREVRDDVRLGLIPGDGPYYDEERENKILIDLLHHESWLAQGKGVPMPPGVPYPWLNDGRPIVIEILAARKVKDRDKLVQAAAPALLTVLGDKGGYLPEFIIPVLVEFGYAKAIPALQQIAERKPEKGDLDQKFPYSDKSYDEVRTLAADAVAKLKEQKR